MEGVRRGKHPVFCCRHAVSPSRRHAVSLFHWLAGWMSGLIMCRPGLVNCLSALFIYLSALFLGASLWLAVWLRGAGWHSRAVTSALQSTQPAAALRTKTHAHTPTHKHTNTQTRMVCAPAHGANTLSRLASTQHRSMYDCNSRGTLDILPPLSVLNNKLRVPQLCSNSPSLASPPASPPFSTPVSVSLCFLLGPNLCFLNPTWLNIFGVVAYRCRPSALNLASCTTPSSVASISAYHGPRGCVRVPPPARSHRSLSARVRGLLARPPPSSSLRLPAALASAR